MQRNLSKESICFSDRITQHYDLLFSNLPKKLQEKIKEELIQKYEEYKLYLDSQFLKNIQSADKNQLKSRLWEFIAIDRLKQSTEVTNITHKDSGPDWYIQLKDGKEYYVEATRAGLPEKQIGSELHRINEEIKRDGKTSCGNELIEEAKTRISTRIIDKLKKHEKIVKADNKGYLLLVSYSELGIDHRNAIRTIMPLGSLTLMIEDVTSDPVIKRQHLAYQNSFKKIKTTASGIDEKYAEIKTDIFSNEKYNWVSAILFSETPELFLLESTAAIPYIHWKKQNNAFMLVHNPTAINPLDVDIFNSETIIRVINNQLIEEGDPILEKFY